MYMLCYVLHSKRKCHVLPVLLYDVNLWTVEQMLQLYKLNNCIT